MGKWNRRFQKKSNEREKQAKKYLKTENDS